MRARMKKSSWLALYALAHGQCRQRGFGKAVRTDLDGLGLQFKPFGSEQDFEGAKSLIATGMFMRQLIRVSGHTMQPSHHHEAGKACTDFRYGRVVAFRGV